MKTLVLFVLAAILSLSAFQSVCSQESTAPNPKEGYTIEKYGELTLEGNYINGKKDGTWLTYFPAGLLNKVEEYRDGIKNGLVIEIDVFDSV